MYFEIVGQITKIETIASGSGIREIQRLRKHYGQGRWRKLKGIAEVRLKNGKICQAEVHWYEAHGLGKKEIKIKRLVSPFQKMKKEKNGGSQFVGCLNNSGYPTSLEVRKIYQKVDDQEAESQNLIRVIDESGEDYLYPAGFFMSLSLPLKVEEALTNLSF